jgi:adenine-specific DNA methylase
VRAEAFPARYRIHKYWGKKPGNVVAAYLAQFADRGTTVLDPFAGSGVVLAEALIGGYRGIAVGCNPIAGLITRVTVEGADPVRVRTEGRRIADDLTWLRAALFADRCARCGRTGEIVATARVGADPTHVDLDCPACGVVSQSPGERDRCLPPAGAFPDADVYPGWQMRKLARAGVERWSQLFTPRNLCAVAHLRRAVERVEGADVRRALLVSFTAHLAQATRMIADPGARGGGPSWKINSYWLPGASRELNPFRYFENRVEKTARGLEDVARQLGRVVREGTDYHVWTTSSAALDERVPPGSVGYVFTDPPYGGEGIQYGELSMLWNLWAGELICLEREVTYNPRRGKAEVDYAKGLTECLAAAYAALAPGCWTSVTFANQDPRVWQLFRGACAAAGFEFHGDTALRPSAPNVTNLTAPAAPKEDRVLHLRKPSSRMSRTWTGG